MAQPGPRARALTRYFSNEHGFEAENYIAGVILYKRRTVQGGVERIVVKHARLGAWWQGDARDPEIDSEENLLRRLWGSEHTIRLLSVVDDRHHRAPVMWAPPLNRNLLNPPPILPWKLGVDPALYPNVTNVEFFVMEFLARGTGEQLIERCEAMNIGEISEPLLWCFFLCLTRGCIGMAYPPNRRNRNPPAVEREVLPPRGQPGPAASRISHGDLHVENMMFGDYDFQAAQPSCHQIVPILKVRQLDNIYGNLFTKGSQIIDFGLAHEDNTPAEAQRENMKFVGELMHQLARVVLDPIVEDRHRPRYMIRNIPGLNDFETYATAEFCRAGNLSYDFKLLVCMCLAVDEARRPTLRPVLEVCERNVGLTPNWMNLKDEVSELFDAVPLLNNGSDSGSEYAP
ncbi:hypothetical protein F4801DRAFT_585991 [Xylaria longipes]|nr:hypothetical protein F4801DRAFT_585991 [Xylaria longipes]